MNRRQKTENRKQKKNLAKALKQRLPADVYRIIRKIGSLAEDNGFSAYIVGGFVRDALLGVENLDLDIVIEGNALAFVKLLKTQVDLKVLTHQRFGTATVTLPCGFKIDIATSRKEEYPHPASLPTVLFSSIREDLLRRDFTINALAIKINRYNFGQLIDSSSGQKDLREAKIRVLHARSFIDDPTRIFRAIRFEQRYNFKIEPKTFRLMRKSITARLLRKLSRFRLGREFILLLKEEKPLKPILRFNRLCGLKVIHPMIKLDKKAQVRLKFPRPQDDWLVYFALLTMRLNEEQLEKLCRDFSLTRKNKQTLKTLRTKAAA